MVELNNIAPFEGGAVAGSDNRQCRFYIPGPAGSPYEGGRFAVAVQFAVNHPHAPPAVRFETKVFHPQVSFDEGHVCMEMLEVGRWSPNTTIRDVLTALQALLGQPNGNTPNNAEAGALLLRDAAAFATRARAETASHARG